MVILALLPLFVLVGLLLIFRWKASTAGLAGLLAALLIGWLAFGLTLPAVWVSQAKGLLLSIYVLAIFWPALYLYYLVKEVGGIEALTGVLERSIGDRAFLGLILAWAFSGFLEGLAGFGIPIAIVAPILVTLGIEPVIAVAAVAVGHAWSVTFGDMGVIFQTLVAVVQMDPVQLIPPAALLLGIACLACGLGAASLLGQLRRWPQILLISAIMGGMQYLLASVGLAPLAAFGAGLAGMGVSVLLQAVRRRTLSQEIQSRSADQLPSSITNSPQFRLNCGAGAALLGYGGVTLFMLATVLPGRLHTTLSAFLWQVKFPDVVTNQGYLTSASLGPAFRVFLHPGTVILLVALICTIVFSAGRSAQPGLWKPALRMTVKAGLPASLGIIATLGLSTLMEYSGMTLLLAQGLSRVAGGALPVISPFIGILGAFASGSNNNSNVLFGMLQKNAALLLGYAPALIVAAQTAGGALGSMIAPAKITVGCSTTGIQGKDGEVLRKTLPYSLAIGVAIGLFVFGLTLFMP